jgi:hypothetical protein
VGLPGTDEIVALHGLRKEQQALREAVFAHGAHAVETATDNKLVEAFAIWGTHEECRQQFAAYEGKLPHVMLHPPSIPPMRPEDTADCFERILDVFGRRADSGAGDDGDGGYAQP